MQTASGGGPLAARVTASAAELLAAIARASKASWPEAAGVPAEAAADVTELAAHVAEYADPALRADAVAAGLVAAGCARAAAELVAVNLTVSASDDRVRRAEFLAEGAAPTA